MVKSLAPGRTVKALVADDVAEHGQQALERLGVYSVTELEGCFGELERLGQERLAGFLRGLRRRHDIEAILAVLQELKQG